MELPVEVSFRYVDNMVRWIGNHHMGRPSHNPSHLHHWGALEDDPEGRAELGRRLREVAEFSRSIAIDDRFRVVLAWGEREGLLGEPAEPRPSPNREAN